MDIETFQQLSIEEVARLVRATGPKVCGFPINGTRRWFALEHADEVGLGHLAYIRRAGDRTIEVCRTFFDHGIDTLLIPIFGSAVASRGPDYQPLIEPGLCFFATDPAMLDFYDAYDVRVGLYGDARRQYPGLSRAWDAFSAIAERTAHHRRHRLFYGACAEDPTETIAQLSLEHYQRHGQLPNKRQIVEAYYGVDVEPLSFCIGFEPMAMFDLPLIASGMEDLYFMVSPSLYLDGYTLRAILYDHLYERRTLDNYSHFTLTDWAMLDQFYRLNRHHVIGIGKQAEWGGWWSPLPQVILPDAVVNIAPLAADGADLSADARAVPAA
jgi:tuberculosinol/isotuberculosinol synthase